VYAMLQVDGAGPGYCHFPKSTVYSETYFKGLTCESRDVKMVNGFKKLFWKKPSGARNEPIDCRNYAVVGFLVYPVNMKRRKSKGLLTIFPKMSAESGIVRRPKLKRRRGNPGL